MSRWWRRPLALRLGPTGPSAAAEPAGRDARVDAALAEFARRLDALDPARGTRVCGWLGSEVARTLVVPWHDGIAHPRQREIFARHCFREVYGAEAEHWMLRVDAAGRGRPALACAVEPRLLDGLDAALAARGLVPHGARPVLMAAFNQALPLLRRQPDAWFALIEGPWITLMLLRGGLPVAVKRAAGPEHALASLVERERMAHGIDEPSWPVWAMRCGAAAVVASPELGAAPHVRWLTPLHDALDVRETTAAPGRPQVVPA